MVEVGSEAERHLKVFIYIEFTKKKGKKKKWPFLLLHLQIGVEREMVNVLLPELVKCKAQAAHAGPASFLCHRC